MHKKRLKTYEVAKGNDMIQGNGGMGKVDSIEHQVE